MLERFDASERIMLENPLQFLSICEFEDRREYGIMAKDRLMCKHCANTDVEKMSFTQGGKYLHCCVCNAETPLYDAYIVYKEDLSERVESLVSLGQHMMDTGEYDHATRKFKAALELAQDCHAAWWGLYVCEKYFAAYYGYQDKYGNSGSVVKANILADLIDKYGNMAIKSAPDEIASLYCDSISDDRRYIQGVIDATNNPPSSKHRGIFMKLFK